MPPTIFVLIMRIDKFLWSSRRYKTRNLAAEACKKARIRVNGKEVKPGSEVREGDVIEVRQTPIWRSFEVIALPGSRVGAKLVPEILAERTSFEDLEALELHRSMQKTSPFPAGKPSKKDRRDLDRFLPE